MSTYIIMTHPDSFGSSIETKLEADSFFVGEEGELVFVQDVACEDCGDPCDTDFVAVFAKGRWSFATKEVN